MMPPRLRLLVAVSLGLACAVASADAAAASARRPNVLLIAVDDLNDWIGALGGNPQAVTPHLDRFARQAGAVAFQRAYCPGPVCGPSRSAMLSGFMPHRSGIYANEHWMLRSELVQTHATLPEYFAKHGYRTLSSGKVFHKHNGVTEAGLADHGQWAFQQWECESGKNEVDPARRSSRGDNMIQGRPATSDRFRSQLGSDFAWGPIVGPKEETLDFRTARWAERQLASLGTNQPFFMAVGIFQPHLDWHVPQEFFDRHPLESIRLPEVKLDDLDDVVDEHGKPGSVASNDFLWVLENPPAFRLAVQAYLAATSFADEAIGVILDALARSPHADNTIVVICGDHGWHLGEKLRFRKATLWAESTRTTLLMRVPGDRPAAVSPRLVNLIDLYPTLVDLAGLPAKPAEALDGRSFAPLFEDPSRPWSDHTLSVHTVGKAAAVIGERWYLVSREGRPGELYDMQADPLQWHNLIGSAAPEVVAARRALERHVPDRFAPPVERNRGGGSGVPDPALRQPRDLARLR